MAERFTRDGGTVEEQGGPDAEFDAVLTKCEKEKETLVSEHSKLREERKAFGGDSLANFNWKESVSVFDKASRDLSSNLDQYVELKTMRVGLEKELSELTQKLSNLRKSAVAGRESGLLTERKAKELNEMYSEKQDVLYRLDSTLKSTQEQRQLILEALKNIMKSLVVNLYDEKVKYSDLKFNMCSFLQEYYRLKKKHKETERLLKVMTEASSSTRTLNSSPTTPASTGLQLGFRYFDQLSNPNGTITLAGSQHLGPNPVTGTSRSLSEVLNDVDNLAQEKLASMGLKGKNGPLDAGSLTAMLPMPMMNRMAQQGSSSARNITKPVPNLLAGMKGMSSARDDFSNLHQPNILLQSSGRIHGQMNYQQNTPTKSAKGDLAQGPRQQGLQNNQVQASGTGVQGRGTSVFKDRSLNISRTSRMSVKSNVSKRYEAQDDEEEEGASRDEESDEENVRARSTNKYQGSYLERSNNQYKSMISTPDKSLGKVRGISPIGATKDSYFLSPER